MTFTGKVSFHGNGKAVSLKNRTKLKTFIAGIFKREGKLLRSLSYIFLSDKELLKINQQFLQHDDYTDIITFDLSETNQVTGEIYISIDRVKENARRYGTSMQEELHRVMFHGALHLCGYSDKAAREKEAMTKKEDENLVKYFSK